MKRRLSACFGACLGHCSAAPAPASPPPALRVPRSPAHAHLAGSASPPSGARTDASACPPRPLSRCVQPSLASAARVRALSRLSRWARPLGRCQALPLPEPSHASSPPPWPAVGQAPCGTWRQVAGRQDGGASASGRGVSREVRPEGGRGPARAVAAAPGPAVEEPTPLESRASHQHPLEETAPRPQPLLTQGCAGEQGGMGPCREWGVTQGQLGSRRLRDQGDEVWSGRWTARVDRGGVQREGHTQAEGVAALLRPRPPQPHGPQAPAWAQSPRCLPPPHCGDGMRRRTKSLLERAAASIRLEDRINPRGTWAGPAAPSRTRVGLALGPATAVQTTDVVSSNLITASPLMSEKQGSFVFYTEYFCHV